MSTERRAYPRVKARVPIELIVESSEAPIRGATSDLSLGGCYVEMLFPLKSGTVVEVRLRVGDHTVIALGIVKTSDPQVGNGIQFLRMLPEDREELLRFIRAVEETNKSEADTASPPYLAPSLILIEDISEEIETFQERL